MILKILQKDLTDPEKDKGFYNTSPALSPQGDKIAFISNRDYYFGLYIMDALTGKTIDTNCRRKSNS